VTANPALRAFRFRMNVATVVFIAAVLLGAWLLGRSRDVPGMTALLAVVAATPAAAFFWIILAYLHQQDDEYLRLLETRKCLVATGFALTVCTFYGFLHIYKVVPAAPLFLVGPLWCVGLVPGALYNRWAER